MEYNNKLKILAIGDFHGKIPKRIKRITKKIDYDTVISPGDFAGMESAKELLAYEKKMYRKYGGDFRDWPKDVQKEAGKKYNLWEKASLKNSEGVIKWLRNLKKPVYFVHGNWDFLKKYRKNITRKHLGMDELKGNLHFIHKKRVRLNNIVLLGFGGYRVTAVKEHLKQKTKGKKIPMKIIKRIKIKWQKRIRRLFKNQKENVIFVIHDPPYNTKLDYIKSEGHIGEKLFSEAIKKYKPLLVICGHMHENQGRIRMGKTTVINPGAAYEGKAALIELQNNKIKNIKFIR